MASPVSDDNIIKVLHVDDEPDLLFLAKTYLHKIDPDLHITYVNNPTEAIKKLLKEDYDCILSDYKMPGMNGIQFAEKVLSLVDIPFILYTGQGSEEVAERAYEVGVDSYIRKEMHSAHYRVLVNRIKSVVGQYRATVLLDERTRELSSLIDGSIDAIFTVNMRNGTIAGNPAFYDIFGYSSEEINDMGLGMLRLIHEDDVAQFQVELEQLRSLKIEKYTSTNRWYTKNGDIIWIDSSISAIIEDEEFIGVHIIARDITERKRAEEDLELGRTRLRGFLDSMDVGLAIWDKDLNYLDANQTILDRFGLTNEELIGKNIQEINPNVGKTGRLEAYKRVIETGEPYRTDEAIIHTSGGERTFSVRAYKVGDGVGNITRDITEERMQANLLRESEKKYRSFLDASRDAVSVNIGSKIVYVNPQFIELLGYSRQELTNRTVLDVTAPEYLDLIRNRTSRRQAGEPVPAQYELELLKKDGSRVPVEFNVALIEYEGKSASLTFIRDISERKQAEHLVELERDRAQDYFDVASVIMVAIDASGCITLLNKKGCEVLEVDQNEAIGLKWVDTFIPVEFRNDVKDVFQMVMTGEIEPVAQYINSVQTKSGDIRVVEWYNTVLRDENGKIISTLSSGTDITERKQAEEEYENLFNLSPDMQCICTPEGEFVKVNPACEKILGYTTDEIVKLGWASLVHPDDMESTTSEIDEQQEGYSVNNFINRFRCKDGSYKTLEWQASPVINGVVYATARDITERRSYEDVVRRSWEEKNAIIEGSADAIIVNDAVNILFMNQKAVELFGYSDRDELVGKPFIDLFSKDHQEVIAERARLRLEGKTIPNRYWVNIVKNGRNIVPVEFHLSVIEYEGKRVILNVIRDISEQRNAEQEIEFLARFLAENTNPVIRINKDGTILYANKAATQQLTNWTPTTGDTVSEEWLSLVSSSMASGETSEYEAVYGERIYSFNLAPVVEADYVNVYGRNVSKIKLFETQLQTLHTHANEMATTSTFDDLEKVTYRAVMDILGFTRGTLGFVEGENLVHRYLWNMDLGEPLFMPLDGAGVTVKAVNSGQTQLISDTDIDPDYITFVPDRELVTRSELVVPIKVQDSVVGVLNIESVKVNQFTETDQMLVETLAEHIGSAMDRITLAKRLRKTQQKNEADVNASFQRFSSMIRHDLRTPLMNVGNAVELIKQDPEMSDSLFELVNRNLGNMNQIITDWRQKTLTGKISREQINVKELVSESLSSMLTPGNISVLVDIDDSLVADLDFVNMHRVLTNLVKNAFEALPGGGTVSINADVLEGRLCLVVSDTGMGMNDETLSNLFTPFYTTKTTGTGLGLAYCKQAVEAHGGDISVESVWGKGSSFTISIPVLSDPVESEY